MSVAINSILVPITTVPTSKIDSIREAVIAKLIELAMEALKLPDDGKLITRDLEPSDLGLTNEVWYETTGATANTWENSDIASKTIADERLVAITGVVDASEGTPVSALRFTVGSSKVAQWNLDRISKTLEREGVTLSPIIITPNQVVTIEHYVKVAGSGTEIGFVGVVCEKVGKTLKP